jgi:hypothetical protein
MAAVLFAVFAVLAAAITAYVVVQRVGDDLPIRLPTGQSCIVTGGSGGASSGSGSPETVSLDATQTANAATIGAVGLRRKVPQRAIVVALATAFQESKLENLDGGDRDSVGLFQQRPSQGWGTREQIADPRYAANAFYTALLKVKGWQQMRITDAAQAVQRSAHPEAYQKWAEESDVLARALTGEATSAVACTISGEPASRGPTAAADLVSNMKLDWGTVTTAKVTDFVGMALTVRETKVGWQYAHWLVAHAEERGVKRVRFGGREWTAKTGTWATVTDGSQSDGKVIAEVFTA